MFYSTPVIHVHCKYQGKESKAEIIYENGKFVEVEIKTVSGKEPLDAQNLRKFKKLVEYYRDDIIRKWVDFFVFNKEIATERITKKI